MKIEIPPDWKYQFTRPTRLRVLDELCAALRNITPENGYYFDLSADETAPKGKVFRGRALFGPTDPIPMLSILETPVQGDGVQAPPDAGLLKGFWDLTIQGFVDDDFENPTDPAHYLVADVIRCLAVEKQKNTDFNLLNMGDDVTKMIIGIPVVRPPDELSAKAYFYLPLTLEMAENLEKPYGNLKP